MKHANITVSRIQPSVAFSSPVALSKQRLLTFRAEVGMVLPSYETQANVKMRPAFSMYNTQLATLFTTNSSYVYTARFATIMWRTSFQELVIFFC